METDTHHIYHLALPEAWEMAQATSRYLPAHFGAEGFIHCSTQKQLPGTAAVHFTGINELVIVVMEAAKLGESLKWELSRNEELFPHLYRAIQLPTDVAYTFTIRRDAQGKWQGWEN